MDALMHTPANGDPVWRLPTAPPSQPMDHLAQSPLGTPAVGSLAFPRTVADRDHAFVELLAAYRGSGGLARTYELIVALRSRSRPDTEQLARWIVTREIISFDWQGQKWFPWFQFDRESGRPCPLVGDIVHALCPVLDDWQMACWFVQPNVSIDNGVPAEELACQPANVWAAAHAYLQRDPGIARL